MKSEALKRLFDRDQQQARLITAKNKPCEVGTVMNDDKQKKQISKPEQNQADIICQEGDPVENDLQQRPTPTMNVMFESVEERPTPTMRISNDSQD